MHFRTIRDVKDGFDGKTGACREHTGPRENATSDNKACFGCFTKICPVLQVQTTHCLDMYGIEIHIFSAKVMDQTPGWPEGWGPQGVPRTVGGGPARVPNLRVCYHFVIGSDTGREGRMNVVPWYRPLGVAKTSSETQRRKNRAARKGEVATWYGDDSPHLSLPNSQPKSVAARSAPAPGCGDTSKAASSRTIQFNVQSRTEREGGSSSVAAVIVGTEKVFAGSGWARQKS